MARGYVIDRTEVHAHLWSISNSRNKVQIYQKALAAKFEVTQATMSRIMSELSADGRIKKVAAKANNVGVYLIADPDEFE